MNDDRRTDPVQKLLDVIAEHLDGWLAGDELALESLGDALQSDGLREEHVQAAILTLRSIAGTLPTTGVVALDDAPGRGAHRMLSPLERESLSPEAWGFLLDLRRNGSLDAGQIERVLGRLAGSGVRPVHVNLARDVATRVALDFEPLGDPGDPAHDDFDLAH